MERFVFEEEQATAPKAERFVFDDVAETPAAPQPKPKGVLESAADIFVGAAARVAQGVNESLGAINKGFGLETSMYDEGAEHWKGVAEDAGSTGLPAKVYQGIGAAPAGVAEFVAGPVYAGAKGAAEGYREGGVPGAMEKAAIEVGKRVAIGKIFHGIENTAISGMTKAGAMGGTMGVQTAAEQAMTPEGIQAEDVAASAITGTLLSVQPGGRSEPVRRNLIKEGVQPEIAADLAGRVQATMPEEGSSRPQPDIPERGPMGEPRPLEARSDMPIVEGEVIPPQKDIPAARPISEAQRPIEGAPAAPENIQPLSVTYHPDKRVELQFNVPVDQKTMNRLQNNRFKQNEDGTWTAKGDGKVRRAFVAKLEGELLKAQPKPEMQDAPRFAFEDQAELSSPEVTFTDPQGKPLAVPADTRAPESIGPLVAETGAGKVTFVPEGAAKTIKGPDLPVEAKEGISPLPTPAPVPEKGAGAKPVDQLQSAKAETNQKADITPLESQFPDTARTESARQAATDTLNQVYPEDSPNIGLAVKPGVVRDDTVTIPQGHKDTAGNFTSADKQVEKRWKEANGLNDGPGLIERGKAFIHRMLSETQHFPELDTASFAGKRTADVLRRFESSPAAAKAKTAEYLHSLTATFGPKKMDTFTRKVILDDLMNEAEKGRELPFGYTVETLKKDHAAVSAIAESHPDIKAAIKRRADVNKALVMDLVDNDLLPVESVLKPEALERYQKSGKYEADDINTGYFRHQVLEHANARRWAGVSATGDVRNKQRGWQKGRQGSEKDINTNFLEAEFEVFSQSMKELATKKALDETLRLNDITPELKAQAKKEGIEDWKTLIPEGHTAWQPEKGSIFYRGQTLPEQIVARFIEENPSFADVASKFREATILGGKKAEVIIPEGLAKTLDSLRTNRDTATLDTINQKLIGSWKVWTLLSPRRAIKYNLNNMSGDMDVAIAADPAIIKHFNTAWKNGLNRRAGRAMSKDEIDMLDRGVIDSGISINEIPDISKLPGFSHLKEADRQVKLVTALRSGDLSKLAPSNLIAKYFDVVSGLTQLREGLLREAAYLRAKELLEQGKKIYWASKPAEIDALPNIKDKAAKLSRELVGDYGNLSAHGEKIRSRFIPFWSWMEINSPRYYRLFKNAAAQGEAGSTAARMAGVGGRKVAGAALGVAEKVLLTQVLFASVSAFNHLVHPEEEERLGDADRKQLHIILGTGSDGKVMTARFQGAFSDALSWFGLENYTEILRNLKDGKMEPGELARKMLMATPNKLANATSPFFKMGAELITGKSFYPDITKPTPIRDKVEHAARFLSLDNEYKALAGKPTRGYMDSLKGLYLYETDPGEAAYQTIRKLAFKHLEKGGKEAISSEPTARSNALYYYKQAIRYGDEEAAEKYKAEYLENGGTLAGIQKSIARAHPMATLPLNQRAKFRQGLSAKEVETLQHAIEWYRQVYQP